MKNLLNMVKDKPNGWLQLLDNNGSFAIKSAYATIQDLRMGGIAEELFIQLWKVDAPRKALHMLWRLLFLNRLPVRENLFKRNIQLSSSGSMCVCVCVMQDPSNFVHDHIFLTRPF